MQQRRVTFGQADGILYICREWRAEEKAETLIVLTFEPLVLG